MKKTLTLSALAVLLFAGLVSIPNVAAVTQNVTEDFEDDSVGSPPTDSWYTFTWGGSGSTNVVSSPTFEGSRALQPRYTSVQTERMIFDLNGVDLCDATRISFAVRSAAPLSIFEYPSVYVTGSSATNGNGPKNSGEDSFGVYYRESAAGGWHVFAQGDGTTDSDNTGLNTDNAWQEFEFTNIDCADARIDWKVNGGGVTTINEPGSFTAPLDRLVFGGWQDQVRTDTRPFYIDKIQIDGIDIPLAGGPRTEFTTEVRSVYTTNDAVPVVYTWDDNSLLQRWDANTSTPSLITAASICGPTFTGVSGSADASGFNYMHVSDNDNVATICANGSNKMLQLFDKTLNTQLTKVTGVQPSTIAPFRIFSEEREDANKYTVAVTSADGVKLQFYQGVPTMTSSLAYSCGTATLSHSQMDRKAELGQTLWHVDDSCGVKGFGTLPPTEIVSAPTVLGTSIAGREDFVWVSDTSANTLKRFVVGGATLTQTHSVNIDYGNIRVSWDGRYLVTWKGLDVKILDASNLTELADFQSTAGDTHEECDIDANNNYIWCGGTRTGGGYLQSFEAFPYTVSEAGDGNATTPNPAVTAGQFDPPTPSGGGGGGNTGTITPNEPKSVVGVDVVAIGDDVIGDGDLFAVIVALAVIGGLAAAGAVGGSQVGIPLWGGVGGGVLGFFGTVMLGWIPVWFLIFIFVLGAAVVVYRFTSNGADG